MIENCSAKENIGNYFNRICEGLDRSRDSIDKDYLSVKVKLDLLVSKINASPEYLFADVVDISTQYGSNNQYLMY